jgi:hypothetical protein
MHLLAIWCAVKRCFASRFISIVGGIVMSQRETTMQRKATLLSFISARFLSAERRSKIFMEPRRTLQEYSVGIYAEREKWRDIGINWTDVCSARFSLSILPFNPD